MSTDCEEPPKDSQTKIISDPIGNAILVCKDGTLHQLSKFEQIWLKLGLTNLNQLDNRYNNHPCKGG